MKHIMYCSKCNKYTMQQVCSCSEKTTTVKPAKYSPDFKYANLRRQAKKEELKIKGLI